MPRQQLNVRMTADDLAIMARLRERLGLDPTGIIRLALRRLAQQEGISMTTRAQQIEKVAGIICDLMSSPESAADAVTIARRTNADAGFTFETSAPLGHTIRHEGVVLTEAEMQEAVSLAESWLS